MLRSRFTIYSVSRRTKIIKIVDNDDGGMSVTNDAENVIAWLDQHLELSGWRVFYRDTMGQWDELLHSNGKFTGFAPGINTLSNPPPAGKGH